jgi:predicted permease
MITPIGGSQWNEDLKIEGDSPDPSKDNEAWANAVSDGYFATLGIPMIAGRDFNRQDTKSSPRVAIVDEALARQFFGTPAAVGRRFQKQEGRTSGPPIEVVGVVGTTKYRSLRDSAQPVMYFPQTQEAAVAQNMAFEVQTSGAPETLRPAIAKAIGTVSSRISLEFRTLEQQLSESLVVARSVASLAGFFGALAILLATIGLYGIMAYSVARRRNEIGVRIALGAEQGRVVRMVLGEVTRVVVGGVVLGIVISLGTTRLVTTFLYGVTPADPATLATAALLLAVVGLAAAAMPARRAARLDPVAALREE